MAAPTYDEAEEAELPAESDFMFLRARALSSCSLLPWGTGMPFLSAHSLRSLSFQLSMRESDRDCWAAEAEDVTEEKAFAAELEAV